MVLSSCDDVAIYDKHDSKLHGQKIEFNVEMVYVPIAQVMEIIHRERRKFKYVLSEKKLLPAGLFLSLKKQKHGPTYWKVLK